MPDAGNVQDWNRYAYVRHNPLIYTDPTGHVPFLVVGAIFLVKAAFVAMEVNDAVGVATGTDLLGNQFTPEERLVTAAMAALPGPSAAYKGAAKIANELPKSGRFARVLPSSIAERIEAGDLNQYLARPSDSDVFITAAADLGNHRTQKSVEKRLTLPASQSPRSVVTFDYDVNKGSIASPVNRPYAEFVPGGRTAGGAREWVIPNRPLNEMVDQGIIRNVQVRHLKRE